LIPDWTYFHYPGTSLRFLPRRKKPLLPTVYLCLCAFATPTWPREKPKEKSALQNCLKKVSILSIHDIPPFFFASQGFVLRFIPAAGEPASLLAQIQEQERTIQEQAKQELERAKQEWEQQERAILEQAKQERMQLEAELAQLRARTSGTVLIS